MIKVIYNKTCGRCVQSEPLTSGMVGQPIELEYSADFDGLTLTAVFTNGKTTIDVLNPGAQCMIPHEVLDTVGEVVKVGIYAVRGDELVIPTVYANIGTVLKGADPSGDVSADPTLPVWAQIQGIIGNLNDLDTEVKNNLVAAINEAAQSGGGSGASISMRADGGYIQYSTDNGKTWVNLIAEADLKGDKGDKGADGAAGPQGPQGEKGDVGPQGPQGDKGNPGTPGKDGAPGVYYGTTQPAGDTHPVWIDPDGDHDDGGLLPAVTASDNGKVLRVVSGAWSPVEIPSGGGGSVDMGITGATVGQIAKITAVDASGVPTAWSPVDMPSGGSSEDMRVIKTITITADDVNSIYFNRDDSGLPFALTKRIRIRMYGAEKNTGSTQESLFFRAGQTTGDASQSNYPIKVNSNNVNYVYDFACDLYSAVNCWYGDFAHARSGANGLYRFVPSEGNNSSDITVREIKLVWSNASVFFPQGATIVVEGM